MVVKMMKWRPWPPAMPCKKFEAKIAIHQLKGLTHVPDPSRISAEIKWVGSKPKALTPLRRGSRRDFTKEEPLIGGAVRWGEEFQCVCALSCGKDGVFLPWEVSFTVFNGLKQRRANKSSLLATAWLNLADYASEHAEVEIPMNIPNGSVNYGVSLNLSIALREIRNPEEPLDSAPKPAILSFPRSPCYGEMFSSSKKEENNKPSPSGGKTTTGHSDESRSSSSSSDFATDSSLVGGSHEEGSEEELTEEDSKACKSFGYGTLAYANHTRDLIYSKVSSGEDEDWVYYSHRRLDAAVMNLVGTNGSAAGDLVEGNNLKRRLMPWRKRRLNLRSSPKEKGEPLLKKHYGEEGGDDIDFDRRQLSSSDESNFTSPKPGEDTASGRSFPSPFGDDDDFTLGAWEQREITNRDGHMKLKTKLFFASIDQRSERADGESACTALVAVIADWLNSNRGHMPVKSQLDGLIREGSSQWRRMCENEAYLQRFPDKHFDLETVVEEAATGARPLSLVPEKSFVGFFRPDGLEHEGFEFLEGSMSFDDIWAEVSQGEPAVYIISWNDHFFVLKVDRDAYYIIDTLGERLYEGCDRAFIMKFDEEAAIERTANGSKPDDEDDEEKETANGDGSAVVCEGKESCKEYVKSFLAAIPIREVQADVKKGRVNESRPLHQRLQIEFHYSTVR